MRRISLKQCDARRGAASPKSVRPGTDNRRDGKAIGALMVGRDRQQDPGSTKKTALDVAQLQRQHLKDAGGWPGLFTHPAGRPGKLLT